MDSLPIDWFTAMLSKPKTQGPGTRKSVFNDWTSWTNIKGILINCGQMGGIYPTWKPFIIKEINQFLGLYVLDSINISPRMEFKFRTQDEDLVNGNNLFSPLFDSDVNRQFKQFGTVFAVQEPILSIPSRNIAPNYKIDPILLHIIKVAK